MKKRNEIDNDNNIIMGLKESLNQRDKTIASQSNTITKLKHKTKRMSIELENIKLTFFDDKLNHIKEIKEQNQKIAVLERALKLACGYIDNATSFHETKSRLDDIIKKYKEQAEKEINYGTLD